MENVKDAIELKKILTDRTIQTKRNNGISSKEVLEEGLPQGSYFSCTLFLIFINYLPDVLQTEKAMYADDLASQHHNYSASMLWIVSTVTATYGN